MMRILIGFNGSEASTAALYDLANAGLPEETQVLILTVAESSNPPKTSTEADRIATVGVRIIRNEFPNWVVMGETATGSPPREILGRAESLVPHLIVLGEPRQDFGEHNIFVGHTSQIILTEAECSVRIARGSTSPRSGCEKILVGFDGSAGAMNAVDAIALRKWPAETEVRLLVAADSLVMGSIGRFVPQMTGVAVETKFASQWATSLASTALAKLTAAGISSSVEVRFGHPKDLILEEAEEWIADNIFVGPHCAANSFERFLIGSVSAAVAARAHCTVEVTKAKTVPILGLSVTTSN